MRSIYLLPVVLLLISPPALARVLDPSRIVEDARNPDLKEGLARYQDLEFAEGLKALEAALADTELAPAERAAAALYGGLMAHSLDDAVRAKALFAQALDAVPDLDLPSEAAPKDQLVFAEAKEARRAQSPTRSEPVKVDIDWGDAPDVSPTAEPLYRKWWFWTGVGAVIASGAVAAILLAGGDDSPPTCGGGGSGCIDVTLPAIVREAR